MQRFPVLKWETFQSFPAPSVHRDSSYPGFILAGFCPCWSSYLSAFSIVLFCIHKRIDLYVSLCGTPRRSWILIGGFIIFVIVLYSLCTVFDAGILTDSFVILAIILHSLCSLIDAPRRSCLDSHGLFWDPGDIVLHASPPCKGMITHEHPVTFTAALWTYWKGSSGRLITWTLLPSLHRHTWPRFPVRSLLFVAATALILLKVLRASGFVVPLCVTVLAK